MHCDVTDNLSIELKHNNIGFSESVGRRRVSVRFANRIYLDKEYKLLFYYYNERIIYLCVNWAFIVYIM